MKFAIVDDNTVNLPNVTPLVFAEEQGSFLVGAAAALKTTACKIGFVGGVETPLIQKFEAGYEAGAKAVAPNIQIDAKYLTPAGDFTGFNDPAKATEVARGQLDGGADIDLPRLRRVREGRVRGRLRGEHGPGPEVGHRRRLGPGEDGRRRRRNERILTSMLKRVDVAVYDYINASAAGDLTTLPKVFDLKVDGVGYATTGDHVGGHRAAARRLQGGDHQRPDHGAEHAVGPDRDEGAGGGMAESTAVHEARCTTAASTPSSWSGSPSGSPASSRTTTSTCACAAARCTRCAGRTGPASRP